MTGKRIMTATDKPESEADYWRKVAIWLAKCHAMSLAHDGRLKRTSAASKARMRGVCRLAETMLSGNWPAGCAESNDLNAAINALRDAIDVAKD